MARKLQNHKNSGLFSALLKNIKMTKQIICIKKKKKERNKTFWSKNFFAKFQSKIIFYGYIINCLKMGFIMEMVTDLTMAALAGASVITVFSRHNLLQAMQQSQYFVF